MSATIYWEPLRSNYRTLGISAPSSFIASMEKVFGNYPWELTDCHVSILEAMAVVYTGNNNPYLRIISLLAVNSSGIKIWPIW